MKITPTFIIILIVLWAIANGLFVAGWEVYDHRVVLAQIWPNLTLMILYKLGQIWAGCAIAIALVYYLSVVKAK